MKKVLVIALVALTAAACTRTERAATVGAASGAIIGGAASGTVRGAAIGAAIGGVAGALIGRADDGRCIYQRRNGRRYRAPC